MDYWKGKIAVVTGASAGIGAHIILDLAKSGIIAIGLARRVENIDKIAADNPEIEGKIISRKCDISDPKSIQETFDWIEKEFDRLHIIVNNAAAPTPAGTTLSQQLPDEAIVAAINTNLTGLILCTRHAYRLMQKHDELGYIININSIRGHISPIVDMNFTSVYSTTKHGTRHLTEVIRTDLAAEDNKRIRVSSVSPGLVKTEREGKIGGNYTGFYDLFPHLFPQDISAAIIYLLGLPPRVNVSAYRVIKSYHLYLFCLLFKSFIGGGTHDKADWRDCLITKF